MSDDILRERAQARPLTIGILLFPDVEVLDFAGPFEVFSVAARIHFAAFGHPPFDVATIARARGPLRARHGLMVVPSFAFADAPKLDLLIVPGGVMKEPLGDAATLKFVKEKATEAALTASVCTGAFVLAKLGFLDGIRATTHWEDIGDLRSEHPHLDIVERVAFVDEGTIVTSAGISAGIEMSLHLVARILGADAARATARQMEYNWRLAA